MKENVISFLPDGSIQHTLKDSFFDTRFLGNRKVERMSEILFSEEKQKFYIKFLHKNILGEDFRDENKIRIVYSCGIYSDGLSETVYFDTYELAVQEEIRIINLARKRGINFN